jgi:hypothetical protein
MNRTHRHVTFSSQPPSPAFDRAGRVVAGLDAELFTAWPLI